MARWTSWKGDSVADEINKKLLDGAETWLRVDVETDSKQHCPVDSGTMRDTHTVQRGDREVVLGVGGSSAPYAKRQHEDASLRHHDGQTDHFLENAANNQADKLSQRLKEAMAK
jgi:hypothetical protein